jgi:hypothetical protein
MVTVFFLLLLNRRFNLDGCFFVAVVVDDELSTAADDDDAAVAGIARDLDRLPK